MRSPPPVLSSFNWFQVFFSTARCSFSKWWSINEDGRCISKHVSRWSQFLSFIPFLWHLKRVLNYTVRLIFHHIYKLGTKVKMKEENYQKPFAFIGSLRLFWASGGRHSKLGGHSVGLCKPKVHPPDVNTSPKDALHDYQARTFICPPWGDPLNKDALSPSDSWRHSAEVLYPTGTFCHAGPTGRRSWLISRFWGFCPNVKAAAEPSYIYNVYTYISCGQVYAIQVTSLDVFQGPLNTFRMNKTSSYGSLSRRLD